MSGRIAVLGAINTDLIAYVPRAPGAGETIAGTGFEQHGGGKAANQAVAAARYGASVVMVGGVGEDDFGRARLDGLAADGIDTAGVLVTNRAPSGVALITVDARGENRICDIPGAREEVTADHLLSALERSQPGLVLSANELALEAQRAAFLWAREHHIPVAFNVAPFSSAAAELLPLVDILIANEGEAADLLGQRGQGLRDEQLMAGLQELGVGDVVLTLGEAGAIATRGGDVIAVPARKVNAVDTTGAGDTFSGVFAAALAEGASFEEGLRLGTVAASISVTRRGAQSSIPRREEIGLALR